MGCEGNWGSERAGDELGDVCCVRWELLTLVVRELADRGQLSWIEEDIAESLFEQSLTWT